MVNTVKNGHMNVEQMAFGICPFLYTTEYYDYCRNLFDGTVSSKVLRHFSFVSMDNESLHLLLPYMSSHKSLLCDPVDNDQLKTWAINAIWFLPKSIHYLYMDKENQHLASMSTKHQLSVSGICGIHGLLSQ